jgi:hypothetical protein
MLPMSFLALLIVAMYVLERIGQAERKRDAQ